MNNVYTVLLDEEYQFSMDHQNEELKFFEMEQQPFFPDYINLIIRDYLKTYG
ncbi:MAG: hypothetical protein ACD_78C00018G0002 [uncultured bacterium (gcode 4)]|uniref:Uncharacterized protein n=1 Tax=uncultured bacterium (gcode 4) TaxID=1234023 RepID=K1YYN1_9BACT|nr:MAG: hypothetical protein ACD_78C00018G0002 [uncultured bacterium (gcode 4)]